MRDPVFDRASVTVNVIEVVPVAVGVPSRSPLNQSVNPGGKVVEDQT